MEAALQAFIKEVKRAYGHTSVDDYLKMTRQALALQAQWPKLREQVAYNMVSLGSYHSEDPSLNEIRELFYDLELPDAHVDTSDGLSVSQKWNQVAELVERGEAASDRRRTSGT